MELRHVQTFQAIVGAGSFVRAAEQLGYAQSTLTLHIQQLEAELGVKLFARQGKRIQLTEAGRALHEQADHLLQRASLLHQTIAELAHGESGSVRLAAIEPFATTRLPELIVRFFRERPHVRLTLEVGGSQRLNELIAAGELDLGLCAAPTTVAGLSFEPLFVDRVALLLPQAHPLAGAPSVPAPALAGQRMLVTNRTCAYRYEVERALLRQGMTLDASLEIGSQEALKRAVQGGLGVGLLPESGLCPPPEGTVVRRIEGVTLEAPIGLVRRTGDGAYSRAFTAFAALLREAFGAPAVAVEAAETVGAAG